MGFAAKEVGASYREFVTDYRTLVRGGIHCHEQYGIDVLSVISDPMREAESFGTQTEIPENGVPHSKEPLLKSVRDIAKLRIPSLGKRAEDRLNAVRLYKEQAGDTCPVIGWTEGPIAEACILRGMQNLMADMLDEPIAAAVLMDICTDFAIEFALAQIEQGADIIGVGDAAASLIGPALYEEFVLPRQQKIIKAINDNGAKVKLHICGNITKILPLVANTGADIVDIDWMVDFATAVELLSKNGKSTACGNFDPVGVLLQGTPKTVTDAVNKCIAASNNRAAIAPGCEVPIHTHPENLKAVYSALTAYQEGALE